MVVVAVVVVVAVFGLLMGSSGITGAVVGVKGDIACYDNSDCNDRIPATEDTCKNPGTIGSLCVNKPY